MCKNLLIFPLCTMCVLLCLALKFLRVYSHPSPLQKLWLKNGIFISHHRATIFFNMFEILASSNCPWKSDKPNSHLLGIPQIKSKYLIKLMEHFVFNRIQGVKNPSWFHQNIKMSTQTKSGYIKAKLIRPTFQLDLILWF